jgi:hypothetical protein
MTCSRQLGKHSALGVGRTLQRKQGRVTMGGTCAHYQCTCLSHGPAKGIGTCSSWGEQRCQTFHIPINPALCSIGQSHALGLWNARASTCTRSNPPFGRSPPCVAAACSRRALSTTSTNAMLRVADPTDRGLPDRERSYTKCLWERAPAHRRLRSSATAISGCKWSRSPTQVGAQ